MTEHLYAAIMAGGGGTRLWPLSRRGKPKQSLPLIGEKTLFQMAVERLDPVIPVVRTLILTIREQAQQLQAQMPELEEENFILEPMPKGTASAIGLAAIYLRRRDPQAVMACLTADHYIPGVASFQKLLKAAYEIAQQEYLVTLGISPTRPDTGYGYIHRGEQLFLTDIHPSYRVMTFTEKPDLQVAEEYFRSGEYFWNSGMFIWHVGQILDEIRIQLPELYETLTKIEASIGTDDEQAVTETLWAGLENVTVDYGVMEGAQRVVVLPADDLDWIDVGDWSRLFDILSHDNMDNVIRAEQVSLIDSKGLLIYQDVERSEKLIAGLGIEDLIIIDTGDILFVCPRSKAPELKKLVDSLRGSDLERYL
jgi:mannose-1-phosphate guanylyltransferase